MAFALISLMMSFACALILDKGMRINHLTMFEMISVWLQQAEKLKN